MLGNDHVSRARRMRFEPFDRTPDPIGGGLNGVNIQLINSTVGDIALKEIGRSLNP